MLCGLSVHFCNNFDLAQSSTGYLICINVFVNRRGKNSGPLIRQNYRNYRQSNDNALKEVENANPSLQARIRPPLLMNVIQDSY